MKLTLKPCNAQEISNKTSLVRATHHLTQYWATTSQNWRICVDDRVVGEAQVVVAGLSEPCYAVINLDGRGVEVVACQGIAGALQRMGYETEVA